MGPFVLNHLHVCMLCLHSEMSPLSHLRLLWLQTFQKSFLWKQSGRVLCKLQKRYKCITLTWSHTLFWPRTMPKWDLNDRWPSPMIFIEEFETCLPERIREIQLQVWLTTTVLLNITTLFSWFLSTKWPPKGDQVQVHCVYLQKKRKKKKTEKQQQKKTHICCMSQMLGFLTVLHIPKAQIKISSLRCGWGSVFRLLA